ncbi:MAG: alpha/beta hydrolase [Planctomycetota bacterium]|nr:MAG: alpha/beta hydrolase [Planctomycetota bacterium]REJ90172.1 MAG: alpha/beta hydrolase [Planctomycetota bacterium]REK20108.1 MAG: alpha/beta hydrolase [Planctomycetota bacterium]REK34298.1 MAG: alpha/beta hydrolase [Planctomycetota bacterium]
MPNSHVELCRVTTKDGLLLDGALRVPEERTSQLPVDACLLVHGTGSNFTAPGLMETYALQALDAGIASLRVNTRGHDLMARIPTEKGSILGGAAYEHIDECRHDLTAWIDFLKERGYRRIALVGHSMGGVKSIFTVTKSSDAPVACLIAMSPPRFSHGAFQRHKLAGQFREDFRRADALVGRGEGETLLQVRQPMPLVMPASGFVAKYGPHDNFDIMRLLPHLRCPALVMIGTESARNSAAFDGLTEALRKMAAEKPWLTVQAVEGADISYAGHLAEPFERSIEWMRTAVTR